MEATDFCSFELSKMLKECGFDGPCTNCYIVEKDNERNIEFRQYASNAKWNSDQIGGSKYPYKHISAPTLWQAQKWLREKWSLHIGVNPLIPSLYWAFFIDDLSQYINPQDGELMSRWTDEMQEEESNRPGYDSYESALSAGITAALELIKA